MEGGSRLPFPPAGVMVNNGVEQTLLQIRQPLAQVSVFLSLHSFDIRKTWTRLLKRCNGCGSHLPTLAGLHLPSRVRDLASTNLRAYRKESEQQGHDLAERAVPAECVGAAIAFYVESCLPYLLAADGKGLRWTRALTRWAALYQLFILSGYSRQEAAERALLEEKIGLAESRSQVFSAQVADAYEKERRRLAQDLHDEIGHDLIVLKLYTQVIVLDLNKGEIGQVRRKLKESVSLIKHALQGVRHLTFDLGPAIWNEQGFLPAIRLYVRQYAVRTGLKVSLRAARLKGNLPARYETALYKVLQGTLSNIAAHAAARRVAITIERRRDGVIMRVEDDGKGFNVERKLSTPPKSYGLRAMRDRIQLLGGTICFSSHPARRRIARGGTSFEFRLPLHGDEAE
jgi:signal transduction histidine kinase